MQRQSSGHVRCGDLALGVTDDGSGMDTTCMPHLRQRDHHSEQHRLHDVDTVESGRILGACQHLMQ